MDVKSKDRKKQGESPTGGSSKESEKQAPDGIGVALRLEREKRGMTLAQIAQTTKIKESALRSLEREAFGELPAPVFVRGFVTAYAREVGLDPKPLLKALHDILEPTQEPVVDLTTLPETKPSSGSASSLTGPRVNIALLVFVLVIVATLTLSLLLRSPGPGAT